MRQMVKAERKHELKLHKLRAKEAARAEATAERKHALEMLKVLTGSA